jgi:hypothetical protein
MKTARQYSAALSRLAHVPSQVAPVVARGIKRQIGKDFDAGRDPYGRAWKPLAESTKARGRHDPPLTDTRKGRRSIRVFATQGAGVQLTVGTGYMWRHQDGVGPPVRRFVPIGTLPKTYREIWQKALTAQVRKTLGQ